MKERYLVKAITIKFIYAMDNKTRVDDGYIGKCYQWENCFVMIPKHEYYETTFQGHNHVYYWNDINLKMQDVISLTIFDSLKVEETFPSIVYELRKLEYLRLPSHLMKQLDWAKLNHLKAFETTNAILKIKESVCLPNLIHLCNYKGTTKFSSKSLPCLKSIICKYTDFVMDSLLNYQIMDNIMFCNVNENICERLSLMKSIRKLDIISGKIKSISGISQINGIEELHLSSLPYLSNADELTDLPNLEELCLNTCKSIRNWDFLLQLKSLKRLTVFNCNRNNSYAQISKELRTKGIIGIY